MIHVPGSDLLMFALQRNEMRRTESGEKSFPKKQDAKNGETETNRNRNKKGKKHVKHYIKYMMSRR